MELNDKISFLADCLLADKDTINHILVSSFYSIAYDMLERGQSFTKEEIEEQINNNIEWHSQIKEIKKTRV